MDMAMKVEPSAALAEESAGTRDDSIATSEQRIEAMRRQKPTAYASEKIGIDRLLIALAALVLLSVYWPGLMFRIRGRPARTPA